MSYSQGNIIFTSNSKSGGTSPVQTLDNGLTLTGTDGELGGSLLHDTVIDIRNHLFIVNNNLGNGSITISNPVCSIINGIGSLSITNGIAALSEGSSAFQVSNTGSNNIFIESSNGIEVQFNGAGNEFFVYENGSPFEFKIGHNIVEYYNPTTTENLFNIDLNNRIYSIGDLNNINNGNQLKIDDINNVILLNNKNNENSIFINNDIETILIGDYSLKNDYINIDNLAHTIQLKTTSLQLQIGGVSFTDFSDVVSGTVTFNTNKSLPITINGINYKIALVN